ncbi:MAG TPA: hypothetical protein DCZ04_10745 [Syntrophorhabdus aromaticivorans]|nr:hypothetical protein [Syntrophorhabdus aromaticivorans]
MIRFSRYSDKALQQAFDSAQEYKTKAYVLRVVHFPVLTPPSPRLTMKLSRVEKLTLQDLEILNLSFLSVKLTLASWTFFYFKNSQG